MRDAASSGAEGGSRGARARDLAKACLQMRLDLTVQFPSDDSKLVGEFKSVSQCKSHVVRSGMRSGGSGDDPHTRPFMTTADAVANKARASACALATCDLHYTYVATNENIADCMTKNNYHPAFKKFRAAMGVA